LKRSTAFPARQLVRDARRRIRTPSLDVRMGHVREDLGHGAHGSMNRPLEPACNRSTANGTFWRWLGWNG